MTVSMSLKRFPRKVDAIWRFCEAVCLRATRYYLHMASKEVLIFSANFLERGNFGTVIDVETRNSEAEDVSETRCQRTKYKQCSACWFSFTCVCQNIHNVLVFLPGCSAFTASNTLSLHHMWDQSHIESLSLLASPQIVAENLILSHIAD